MISQTEFGFIDESLAVAPLRMMLMIMEEEVVTVLQVVSEEVERGRILEEAGLKRGQGKAVKSDTRGRG